MSESQRARIARRNMDDAAGDIAEHGTLAELSGVVTEWLVIAIVLSILSLFVGFDANTILTWGRLALVAGLAAALVVVRRAFFQSRDNLEAAQENFRDARNALIGEKDKEVGRTDTGHH